MARRAPYLRVRGLAPFARAGSDRRLAASHPMHSRGPMTDDKHDDHGGADEQKLAADHRARGTPDPQHGAIYGEHSTEQANAWETAKIDLSSEARIEREQLAAKGEAPASRQDEARHGANVLAVPHGG